MQHQHILYISADWQSVEILLAIFCTQMFRVCEIVSRSVTFTEHSLLLYLYPPLSQAVSAGFYSDCLRGNAFGF